MCTLFPLRSLENLSWVQEERKFINLLKFTEIRSENGRQSHKDIADLYEIFDLKLFTAIFYCLFETNQVVRNWFAEEPRYSHSKLLTNFWKYRESSWKSNLRKFVFGKQSGLQHWVLEESELLHIVLKGFNV